MASCTRTDSNGDLNVFNVEHDSDDRWLNTNNGRPDNVWNPDNRWVFVRSNPLHFSPGAVLGEFCLMICPCQPPSILPTSSNGAERAMNFLSSSDFVSQRINSSTFAVSSLRLAS